MISLRFVLLFLSLSCAGLLSGEVSLPRVFSDHAVLQHSAPIWVWGTATAGEKVVVTYLDQKKETKADAGGRWSVKIDPLQPGQRGDFVVTGTNTLTLKDVQTGEVWLCSGQSNMAMEVREVADAAKETAAADHPQIRMFTAPTIKKDGTVLNGTWQVCSPETVARFSAVGYFFGRALNESLKMPVGLLNASVGGTPIEAWGFGGGCYANGISPLIPYAIRGAIWYQGEANAGPSPAGAAAYQTKLTRLIKLWRSNWGYDFPFAWVQLPNFKKRQELPVEDRSRWAAMREGMLKTKEIPNTGMAIAIDLGGGDDAPLHPVHKREVGRRLAQWALAKVYDRQGIPESGPIPTKHEIKGREVIVTFTHADGGLVAKDSTLKSFAIAGEDQHWVWANARIEGNTVVISSPEIQKPIAVRYAWADNPIASLYNGAGLAASPFRTDAFPLSTENTMSAPAK